MPARRRLRWAAVVLVVAVAVTAVANIPTVTMRGVNFVVTPQHLPLYAKALDFVDRDSNYRRVSREVLAGAATDEARVRTALAWTRAHVHDTPAGLPIVDDHLWNIVVRGYGQDDQKSDVFTMLLTYAAVPAYWIFIGPRPELALSLVWVDRRWRAVDVANGVIFKTAAGAMASAEDLAADRSLAASQGPATYQGLPYSVYFERFHAPEPPDLMHAEMQMPGSRLWFELRRLVGGGGRPWDMRPVSREAGHPAP